MKSLLTVFAALVAACGLANADMTKDCPVTGKGTSRPVAYAKTVAFESALSKANFDKDPKKYLQGIADYDAKTPKDPITGKKADPKITSEFKATIGVCCNKCVAKVTATPDKYLVKALQD
jgi:YHS domain-containing protein